MGVVETIVAALHTSHKSFAANGIHSRPLAELLLELDGELYLSESDRQDVIEKSMTLSHVRVFSILLISTDHPSETLSLKRAGCRCSGCPTGNPLTCPGHGREGAGTAREYSLVQISNVRRVVFEGLGQHRREPSTNLNAQLQPCGLQDLRTTLCGPSIWCRPATSTRPR
jgi:hypothetical protein